MNLLLHLVTSKECLGMVGHFHWVTKLIVLNNIVHGLFTCLQTTMYKCITHCLEEPFWVWTLVSNSGAADEFWPRVSELSEVSEVAATEKWEQFNLSGMICCYWLKIWKDHLLMCFKYVWHDIKHKCAWKSDIGKSKHLSWRVFKTIHTLWDLEPLGPSTYIMQIHYIVMQIQISTFVSHKLWMLAHVSASQPI